MPKKPVPPASGGPSPFSDEKAAPKKNRKPVVTPNQSRLPPGLSGGKGQAKGVKPLPLPGKSRGR